MYANVSVDGQYKWQRQTVLCADERFFKKDDEYYFEGLYMTTIGCSFGGLAFVVLLVLSIWMCCVDWCRCCCCKPKEYSQIKSATVYV